MRPRGKPEIGMEEELKMEKARPKEMEMDGCGRGEARKRVGRIAEKEKA